MKKQVKKPVGSTKDLGKVRLGGVAPALRNDAATRDNGRVRMGAGMKPGF